MRLVQFVVGFLCCAGLPACRMTNAIPAITVAELSTRERKQESFFLLDVRTRTEAEAGRLNFTDALIPYDKLASHLDLLPSDKETLIYCFCRSGRRSGISTEFLRSLGYKNVFNVTGGIIAWHDADLDLIAGQLDSTIVAVD